MFGLYAGAALTEVIALGQFTPYTKELIVESRVLQIASEYGGIAAIYSGHCEVCKLLRYLEIRPEDWLNYSYNPF